MTGKPRIVFFPGLGADHRLFHFQRSVFPSIEVPPWLPPAKAESICTYASRMRDYIGPCDFLGGSSFGGMMAQEIARQMDVRGVVLIGSARSLTHVPSYLKVLERLIRLLPVIPQGKIPALMISPLFGKLNREQRMLFISMFQQTPQEFLKWSCTEIMRWQGVLDLKSPVFQIHGDKDRILPIEHSCVNYLIRGAGHLLTITHPDEVNSALRGILSQG